MMKLSLCSLAGLAVANAASVPFNSVRTHIHQLLSRQTSSGGFDPNTIPAQCQTSCNTFSSAVISCESSTLASCGCSTATEQGLVTCLNCLIGLNPAEVQTAQGIVDSFVQNCDTAGAKLPAATVSGGVAGTPTTTDDSGNNHSATVTGLSPTTSHDAGDDHGGSSGNSGSGSGNSGSGNSNPSPTPGAAGGSNSGSSNSGSSSSGSGNTNPLTGSSTGAASRTLPEMMASVGLALIGVFFTLAA